MRQFESRYVEPPTKNQVLRTVSEFNLMTQDYRQIAIKLLVNYNDSPYSPDPRGKIQEVKQCELLDEMVREGYLILIGDREVKKWLARPDFITRRWRIGPRALVAMGRRSDYYFKQLVSLWTK